MNLISHCKSVMPTQLKGSCHCGEVRFTVESNTPIPYQVRRLQNSQWGRLTRIPASCAFAPSAAKSAALADRLTSVPMRRPSKSPRDKSTSGSFFSPSPSACSATDLASLLPSVYHAVLDRDTHRESIASSERNFCSLCSAMLWLYDKDWCVPSSIHRAMWYAEFVLARLDEGPSCFTHSLLQSTPLPLILPRKWCVPPSSEPQALEVVKGEAVLTAICSFSFEQVVVMAESKPDYVRLPEGPRQVYQRYPSDSIEKWHKEHGKYLL